MKNQKFLNIFFVILLLLISSLAIYFAFLDFNLQRENKDIKKQLILAQTTKPEEEPTKWSLPKYINRNLAVVLREFNSYEMYNHAPIVAHNCYTEEELPNEQKYLEIRDYLTNHNRSIKILCSTESSYLSLVQSIDKKDVGDNTNKIGYHIELYRYYPKDERDIPSPHVVSVYKADNLEDPEVFKLSRWLEDNTIFYTIFDLVTEEFQTYAVYKDVDWGFNNNYSNFVEYCEVRNGKSNACWTVNTGGDSLFWPLEKSQQIYGHDKRFAF